MCITHQAVRHVKIVMSLCVIIDLETRDLDRGTHRSVTSFHTKHETTADDSLWMESEDHFTDQ